MFLFFQKPVDRAEGVDCVILLLHYFHKFTNTLYKEHLQLCFNLFNQRILKIRTF